MSSQKGSSNHSPERPLFMSESLLRGYGLAICKNPACKQEFEKKAPNQVFHNRKCANDYFNKKYLADRLRELADKVMKGEKGAI